MSEDIQCPECGGTIAGIEVWGVYDGALFWQCMACGRLLHRWPEGHPLREKAQGFMDDIRREREGDG
jgi:hypothetical protein